MKKLLLLFLLLAPVFGLRAQTFEEWFNQKETQKKYLVQQIAALRAYAGTLRQGYALLEKGTSTVQQIKNGDLGLHRDFFGSLKSVKPLIRSSPKAADILSYQAAILREFTRTLAALRRSGLLTASEADYLEKVQDRVLAECGRDLEALRLLLAEGELGMADDKRLARLDALHARTREHYRFTLSFTRRARLLVLQRARKKADIQTMQGLYGIP